MTGKRKFVHGLVGVICFTMILILSQNSIDPLSLGVGMAMVLFPTSAANAVEHLAKRNQQ